MNWLICIATVSLALGFGSSARIAHAYGVGVSCTMLIDTILIMILLWGTTARSARAQVLIVCGVLAIDAAFVISNLGKVPNGGWFPIAFGLAVWGGPAFTDGLEFVISGLGLVSSSSSGEAPLELLR